MKKFVAVFIFLIIGTVTIFAQDDGGNTGFNIWTIISAALGILTTIFGTMVAKVRGKVKQILSLGKETLEAGQAAVSLANTAVAAFDDNTITAEEKLAIKTGAEKSKAEWQDVRTAWKVLWGKEQ